MTQQATSVGPTQRATVWGPRCSCFAVRGDQFHATAGQVSIQAVRLVGVVPDETHSFLQIHSLAADRYLIH
jgi:hypothetical protein